MVRFQAFCLLTQVISPAQKCVVIPHMQKIGQQFRFLQVDGMHIAGLKCPVLKQKSVWMVLAGVIRACCPDL